MNSSKNKILIIATSHTSIGNTGHPTGVWIEELTTPYYAFADAGLEVDIASVGGGKVPVDPGSVDAEGENPQSVDRFLKSDVAMAKFDTSAKIDDVAVDDYAAIFLPGGHGTMWDLPSSTVLSDLLSDAWRKGRVIAAVCHGPAGLVNVRDETGAPLVSGRRVSAFTNDEEEAAGLTEAVPFLLESRLRDLGAVYESGPQFQPHAVRDGKLVTGQNPQSSERVAELTLQALNVEGALR